MNLKPCVTLSTSTRIFQGIFHHMMLNTFDSLVCYCHFSTPTIMTPNWVCIYTKEGCACGTINFNLCTSAYIYKLAVSYSWQIWSCWEGTIMVWSWLCQWITMDNVAFYIFCCLELCYYKYADLQF